MSLALQKVATEAPVNVPQYYRVVIVEDGANVTSNLSRSSLERFICQHYWLAFQACITNLPRRLVAVIDEQGNLCAACGLQFADEQSLFSERYLSQAAGATQLPVARNELIEIGSLAVSHPRYMRVLFGALIEVAHSLKREWMMFTLTTTLRRYMARLGLRIQVMAAATHSALSEEERLLWGQYYQQQPQVCLGHATNGRHLVDSLALQLAYAGAQDE